jgi:hypothetical protein
MVSCLVAVEAAVAVVLEAELLAIVPSVMGASDTTGADAAAAAGAADLGVPRQTFACIALFERPVGAASSSAAIVLMEEERRARTSASAESCIC